MDDVWARMFERAAGEDDGEPPESSPFHRAPEADANPKSKEAKSARKALRNWLIQPVSSEGAADSFRRQLDEGGLVVVEDFLPNPVAEGMLLAFHAAPQSSWEVAEAKTDTGRKEDGAGSVPHRYGVGDGTSIHVSEPPTEAAEQAAGAIAGAREAIEGLLPGRMGAFQRYTKGCFIEAHDDIGFKDVEDEETGEVTRHARDIACIYYLTKNWGPPLGGLFVDLEGGEQIVPKFNSLVAFRVPRLHMVTPMETNRSRYSVFGWFYKPAREGGGVAAGGKGKVKKGEGAGGKKGEGKKRRPEHATAAAGGGAIGAGGTGGGEGAGGKKGEGKKRRPEHAAAAAGGGAIGAGGTGGGEGAGGKKGKGNKRWPEHAAAAAGEGMGGGMKSKKKCKGARVDRS